ncbi:hypothetical protein BDN72DRAFT_841915 [Pluteus cervinus]|uniref:Uncharacterized protein n=1 Tax=Pluteus cervinus TaxID=181527 RepID=A0ACD3ARJ6_9AGAR|nr:hypothetical protein BDN72DRAFT_841915 [Pluteus cervinus]
MVSNKVSTIFRGFKIARRSKDETTLTADKTKTLISSPRAKAPNDATTKSSNKAVITAKNGSKEPGKSLAVKTPRRGEGQPPVAPTSSPPAVINTLLSALDLTFNQNISTVAFDKDRFVGLDPGMKKDDESVTEADCVGPFPNGLQTRKDTKTFDKGNPNWVSETDSLKLLTISELYKERCKTEPSARGTRFYVSKPTTCSPESDKKGDKAECEGTTSGGLKALGSGFGKTSPAVSPRLGAAGSRFVENIESAIPAKDTMTIPPDITLVDVATDQVSRAPKLPKWLSRRFSTPKDHQKDLLSDGNDSDNYSLISLSEVTLPKKTANTTEKIQVLPGLRRTDDLQLPLHSPLLQNAEIKKFIFEQGSSPRIQDDSPEPLVPVTPASPATTAVFPRPPSPSRIPHLSPAWVPKSDSNLKVTSGSPTPPKVPFNVTTCSPTRLRVPRPSPVLLGLRIEQALAELSVAAQATPAPRTRRNSPPIISSPKKLQLPPPSSPPKKGGSRIVSSANVTRTPPSPLPAPQAQGLGIRSPPTVSSKIPQRAVAKSVSKPPTSNSRSSPPAPPRTAQKMSPTISKASPISPKAIPAPVKASPISVKTSPVSVKTSPTSSSPPKKTPPPRSLLKPSSLPRKATQPPPASPNTPNTTPRIPSPPRSIPRSPPLPLKSPSPPRTMTPPKAIVSNAKMSSTPPTKIATPRTPLQLSNSGCTSSSSSPSSVSSKTMRRSSPPLQDLIKSRAKENTPPSIGRVPLKPVTHRR